MINKKSPEVASEVSEPLAEDKRVFVIKNAKLLKLNVYTLKEDLNL